MLLNSILCQELSEFIACCITYVYWLKITPYLVEDLKCYHGISTDDSLSLSIFDCFLYHGLLFVTFLIKVQVLLGNNMSYITRHRAARWARLSGNITYYLPWLCLRLPRVHGILWRQRYQNNGFVVRVVSVVLGYYLSPVNVAMSFRTFSQVFS